MIVSYFHVGRALRRPPKAHSKLIVDSNRMLALAIPLESFQTISGRPPQVAEVDGGIKISKLAARNLDYIREKTFWAFAAKYRLGDATLEPSDYKSMYHPMIQTARPSR